MRILKRLFNSAAIVHHVSAYNPLVTNSNEYNLLLLLVFIFCTHINYVEKKHGRRKQISEVEETTKFAEDIVQALTPGSSVIIKGKVRSECKRFAVNFLSIHGSKSDVAFHFNPRLALRYIVRNAKINNSWGDEETTSIEKFHVYRTKTFELQFVATETEFLVALNGRHVCAFVYRIPLAKINKLQVDGSVDIDSVEHKEVPSYPSEATSLTVPLRGGKEDRVLDQQLVVPVTAALPQGFKEGWQLEIFGRVKILPASFYINLQVGDKLWPHPVIPLHLNPRFYTSYGNHLFVRNAWHKGSWGSEERTAGFQFTPGKKFSVAIRRQPDHFAVWVDGNLAGEFKFRDVVDGIDTVYIHGDVQVYSIYMRDHFEDAYFSKSKETVDKL
ncbi:galectin-8-like isoform X2 [Rhynchophorus ferrugineus]|uniref:galectin-8-like isoform X2 n=1 Tax=Rhynchophorus ferrugineus TaxID=354439 RepID=UPI003FCECDC8